MRLTLSELKKKISKLVPSDVNYEVDLEAGSISIITDQPSAFGGSGHNLTVRNAKTFKRRIVIRPQPDLLADEGAVHDAILKFIPDDAKLRKTWIDPAICQVTLECDDPSAGVGPKGSNIKALRDEIGWLVDVVRAPAIESRTQHDIRRFRKELAEERKSLMRKFGTRIYRPPRPGEPWVRVTALGSYREVGRAMHLVTTNESKVLVDCGAKPTTNRSEVEPFFTAP